MKNFGKKRYFGNRAFYKNILIVSLPIMVQNGITNFVSLLDNIMVGRLGTNEMTGVASANQLIVVFNLCCFGIVAGAGIFTAQFYGKGDMKGVADSTRFKLYAGALFAAIGTFVFSLYGKQLVNLYLSGEGEVTDAAAALSCGYEYLNVMIWALVPFVIVQCYGATLRESGETFLPMLAGIIAVFLNLGLNYLLIFGHLGLPALGVKGAAIATVISRWVEAGIVVIWPHTQTKKYPAFSLLFRTAKIPFALTRNIIIRGLPLMINEFLWAGSVAAITQCYSVRGLHVMAALNISSTISNVFVVVGFAIGTSVSIVVGQLLGAGKMEEAVDTARKMIVFAALSGAAIGIILVFCAPLFPKIYNTTEEVRALAASLIRICGCFIPVICFINACYFTLRTGGKTVVTFLFDSAFATVIVFPSALILAHLTNIPIIPMYAIVQSIDLIKCVIGTVLVKKRVWVNNIVSD